MDKAAQHTKAVREGAYRPTAKLAKFLGMAEDGAELLPWTGSLAYGKLAAAKSVYDEGQRFIRRGGFPLDRDTGLPVINSGRFHD